VLAPMFEKDAEFSSFLFKHRFISNSSVIKHSFENLKQHLNLSFL